MGRWKKRKKKIFEMAQKEGDGWRKWKEENVKAKFRCDKENGDYATETCVEADNHSQGKSAEDYNVKEEYEIK